MTRPNIGAPRSPGTFSLVPFFICVLCLLGGLDGATQWLAARVHYNPGLGDPWFQIGTVSLYAPWAYILWDIAFYRVAPRLFLMGWSWVGASIVLMILLVRIRAMWRERRSRVAGTYGTASFLTEQEYEAAGVQNQVGVVLGRTRTGRYLRHEGTQHLLSIAPTRSGKGVGQVIPTLLTWPHSVVAHDIKAENWMATAGHRSGFSHCLYFNPADPRSCHYNPLLAIRPGMHQVQDVQNVADSIVDPHGTGTAGRSDAHWIRTAHSFLVGTILHVLYAEADKTLAGIARFLANPKCDIKTTLKIMAGRPYPDPVAQVVIASSAAEMLQRDERERSAVLSTVMSFLGLYRDPIVAANTADSDFRLEDFREGERPISLYLCVPPSDITRLMPLLRLFWSQMGRRLTEDLHATVGQRPVLMMVDEFPSLGKLDFFQSSLAFLAGFGIRVWLFAQSKAQIDQVYGVNNSIVDNCHVRCVSTPNDAKTAEEISTLLGVKTEVHQQRILTGHRLSPWLSQVMVSDQEVSRPLLTAGEVLTFPSAEQIIFIAGHAPMRCYKIRYFEDRNFTRRASKAPALTTARPYPYGPTVMASPWAGRILDPWVPPPDPPKPPVVEPPDGDLGREPLSGSDETLGHELDDSPPAGDALPEITDEPDAGQPLSDLTRRAAIQAWAAEQDRRGGWER